MNLKLNWEKALRRAGISEDGIKRLLPLFNESLRGSVLIAVAELDEALDKLHRTYVQNIVTDSKVLMENLFKPYAPLSSLAGRTQIAFAYGLIGADDYADLNLVRKIRNLAAHSEKEFTFTPELRKELSRLTILSRVSKSKSALVTFMTLTESKDQESVKLYFLLSILALKKQIAVSETESTKRATIIGAELKAQRKRTATQATHNFEGSIKQWVCSACGVTYDTWDGSECPGSLPKAL